MLWLSTGRPFPEDDKSIVSSHQVGSRELCNLSSNYIVVYVVKDTLSLSQLRAKIYGLLQSGWNYLAVANTFNLLFIHANDLCQKMSKF